MKATFKRLDAPSERDFCIEPILRTEMWYPASTTGPIS